MKVDYAARWIQLEETKCSNEERIQEHCMRLSIDLLNAWNQQLRKTHGEKFISEEDESCAKATTGLPITTKSTADNATVKVLGSIWNTAIDQFKFDFIELSEQAKLLPTTKPSLLKVSAKIL